MLTIKPILVGSFWTCSVLSFNHMSFDVGPHICTEPPTSQNIGVWSRHVTKVGSLTLGNLNMREVVSVSTFGWEVVLWIASHHQPPNLLVDKPPRWGSLWLSITCANVRQMKRVMWRAKIMLANHIGPKRGSGLKKKIKDGVWGGIKYEKSNDVDMTTIRDAIGNRIVFKGHVTSSNATSHLCHISCLWRLTNQPLSGFILCTCLLFRIRVKHLAFHGDVSRFGSKNVHRNKKKHVFQRDWTTTTCSKYGTWPGFDSQHT